MPHRKPGRATIQWLMFKADLPASPFVRFCLGLLIVSLGIGMLLLLGQPVLLALLA